MPTLLRMPDEIYQRELPSICAPHGAYYMLRDALYGRPAPQPHFYSHLLEFLARNYNAPAHLLEDAFTVLQQDLEQGRVLITDPWALWPAFFWIPAKEDKEGYWHLGNHVFAEHRAILQLTLDNAKSDVPGASVDGAMEAPSALARTFDKAKGAAKQFANDIARRTAAQHAEWQADNGMAAFTDTTTGKVLSADEVKDRWENEGNDVVPIAGGDEAQGAQMVKESPALGAISEAAMLLGSRGRSAVKHPDDVVDSVGDLVKGRKGPDIDKHNAGELPHTPKPVKMKPFEPSCFQPGPDARKNFKGNDKDFEKEYYKQLKMQENGINNMNVGEYLENRRVLQELTDQHGSEKAREILTKGGKAQKQERTKLRREIQESVKNSLEKKGIVGKQARELAAQQANKQLDQLAALHNPDLVAGGNDEIGRMGNKGVNSSIGAQWPKQGRVTGMDEAAQSALEQFGPDAKMNVKLERCR